MSASRFCPACGAEVRPAARFCHRCGAGMDSQSAAARGAAVGGASGGASNILPWSVAGIALLCLLAFIVGQNFRKAPASAAAPAAGPVAGGAPGRAPDISQMGPEERADRLFQRVMTYVGEGKTDSVQFFSPMAIQSMQALAPLDAHRRYDLGLLGMVSGDAVMARAQADSILSAAPNHLLGLILAMRTSGMQLDSTARRGYVTRFIEVVDRERASGKQEYVDHGPDIDAALREARGGASTPR